MSPINDALTRYGLRPPNQWGNPNFSGQEVVEDVIRDFNQMGSQRRTDPQTGQTIVTKEMVKPYGPPDLDAPYTNLFRSPTNSNWGMQDPILRSSWLLPAGAFPDPSNPDPNFPWFQDRSAPTSDAARQSGFLTGVESGGPSVSTLNPQTHWPESTFKVPLREYGMGGPYGAQEPVFNSVTDFTTGRYHVPPTPGAISQSYGSIDGGVPGYNNDMIPPVMPTDFDRMYRQSLLRRMV